MEKKEDVVESRIAVNRGPTSMMRSGAGGGIMLHMLLQPVRLYTMRVANQKRMLTQVALTEKVISTL